MIQELALLALVSGHCHNCIVFKAFAKVQLYIVHASLRLQNDWIEHCARWTAVKDGIVRDNCYNHTEEVWHGSKPLDWIEHCPHLRDCTANAVGAGTLHTGGQHAAATTQ